MNNPVLRIGMVSVLLLGVAACSTVGEKDFACPGRPPGVRCMSATEVYGATHDTDQVAPTSDQALGDDPKRSPPRNEKSRPAPGHKQRTNQAAPPAIEQPSDPSLLRAQALAPLVDKPIPIRTPAQVMRAWIAPWEDARGVLHAGGYAFIEVESRRWTFGETLTTAEPVRFFSIQHSTTEAKETVGKDRSVPAARAGTSERSERPNSSTLPKTGVSK
jgi:conjugal transfer pilus assembly protein TraV